MVFSTFCCRSPHGERGLKSILFFAAAERVESLSSWRAWIEIQTGWIQWHGAGRSPHGERGLKYRLDFLVELRGSRSPHGERGLKLFGVQCTPDELSVALLMESVD